MAISLILLSPPAVLLHMGAPLSAELSFRCPHQQVNLRPYIWCAGASVASFFLASRSTVSLGASGAVFGLFSMAVLSKFRLHPKKLMECAVLGQFVIKQLVQVGKKACNLHGG